MLAVCVASQACVRRFPAMMQPPCTTACRSDGGLPVAPQPPPLTSAPAQSEMLPITQVFWCLNKQPGRPFWFRPGERQSDLEVPLRR